MPTGDVEYLGDNQFSSDLLGDFELDTSIKNRVIHSVLGPLVWEWDEATELVTLRTEWWGDLYTHVPGTAADKISASGLGFEWPYVKSKVTGAPYFVNVNVDTSNPEFAPFYNHRQVNGQDIGWQRSIGVDLSNAENYYKAAETIVGQMQTVLATMVQLQNEYVDMSVAISSGQGPIDEKFAQIEAQFLTMHELYVNFVFYYHRCSLAPVWAAREGKTEAAINLARAYVNQLPSLESTAVAVYGNGQEVLYVNSQQIKNSKTNTLNAMIAEEAARQAAAAAAAAAKNNSGSSGGTTNPAPTTPTTPTTPTPPTTGGSGAIVVDGDAINWSDVDQVGTVANQGIERFNVSAQLNAVNPHIGNYYGPTGWYLGLVISGTQNWQSYDPYNTGGLITGNIWIFVPQGNGRYWATVFEGYGNFATNFPAGNLNFEHYNILAGTPMSYPWQPQSGVQYGWMVSTNLIYPGRNGDQRSNIIIQAWP